MILTLAAWLHDLDPFAVGFIRWYGLSYLLGFAIAWALVRRVARVGVCTLQPAAASDLVVFVAIGVVVGGRLGYVLFYQPSLLWTVYDGLPFWGVLAIHEGGMASHGGMLGAIAAAWLFARRQTPAAPTLHLLDLLAFAAPLGLFFGRIANFINGELIGRPAPAGLPWAVKFPQEMRDWSADRLAELHERLAAAGHEPWSHGVNRIIDAIQQNNEQVIAVVEPMLTPRHPSQIYAAILEGLVVFAALLWAWRRPRVPGVITGMACITYAVGRIVNELFRMPDAHLRDAEFAWLQITRGQWLSALLLLLGVAVLCYARRRDGQPMGGWRGGKSGNAEKRESGERGKE